MPMETLPIFKQPEISAERMKDISERVNRHRNGTRNVSFTEEEIRTMITKKLRNNSKMKVEDAVDQIILERQETINGLNNMAA
jgi:hypothetical protein